MPRAGSDHRRYNQTYEARMKAAGWVRGPRLTPDAADALRELAHRHRLTPSEVVCRLLLEKPLGSNPPKRTRAEHIQALVVEFGVDEAQAEVMLSRLRCD